VYGVVALRYIRMIDNPQMVWFVLDGIYNSDGETSEASAFYSKR